jgi:hypothetical protein
MSDEVRVLIPPPDPPVRIHTIGDALDLVFTVQPDDDALVAFLDGDRRVELVLCTARDHLADVPEFGASVGLDLALVCTADPVGPAAPEDELVAWHRMRGWFAAAGIALLDWLQIDDRYVRSLAETASDAQRWPRAG